MPEPFSTLWLALPFAGVIALNAFAPKASRARRIANSTSAPQGSNSDSLPFDRLWYGEPNAISHAIGYAMHRSRSHDAVIRVYDDAGNVIATHEHKGAFEKP